MRDIEIKKIYIEFIPLNTLNFMPSLIRLYTFNIFVQIKIYPNRQNMSGKIIPHITHIIPFEKPNKEKILHIYIPMLVHFKVIKKTNARGVYITNKDR